MNINLIFLYNFLIFLSYIGLYEISMYLFNLDLFYGNLIFLPHSIRLIAAVIFGWVVWPGLYIAHLFSNIIVGNDINAHSLIISLNASLSGYIAVFIITFFNIKNFKDLTKIQFNHILFVVFFAGIFNSIGNFLIKDYFLNNIIGINFILSYLIGDFIGGFIGLYLILKFLPFKKI